MPEAGSDYRCLALACLETLWPLRKIAFVELNMLHQVGSSLIEKCWSGWVPGIVAKLVKAMSSTSYIKLAMSYKLGCKLSQAKKQSLRLDLTHAVAPRGHSGCSKAAFNRPCPLLKLSKAVFRCHCLRFVFVIGIHYCCFPLLSL